jgi:uncharacterized Ntn-hydrolase superfamily protein
MNMLKRTLLTAILLAAVAAPASATWSVIAIDTRTGVVVIASATCVLQANLERFPAKGLMDIQAVIAPGRGVAAAQAGVDRTRANQTLIYKELLKGTAPAAIIELLRQDPGIDRRQFGVVDLQGRSAGFSGAGNGKVSLDRQGSAEGGAIVYSVQGNILTSERVVTEAAAAFERASGELSDRVMAAMEAADREGGDSRCTCQSEPVPAGPCETRTAHVAYILLAGPKDANVATHNDGAYSMFIDVTDQNVAPGESVNPVKTLRMRYDARRRQR